MHDLIQLAQLRDVPHFSLSMMHALLQRGAALTVGAVCVGCAGLAAQTQYVVAPAPAWVKPVAPAAPSPTSSTQSADGFEILLLDRQEAVRSDGIERYTHWSYQLHTQSAVQQHSQVEIVFDPTYQEMILHSATVTRAGQSVDQLKPRQIRVVQREASMDYQVYDGRLTLVLVLEDVRPGDVVEYSYTRRGVNPVFAGHYMSDFTLQATVSLRKLHFRLLWPGERRLYVQTSGASIEPAVRDSAGVREYVWARVNVAPKVLEPDLPDWYEPLPAVRLSDFGSWSQVAAWGDSLFPANAPVPPLLGKAIEKIRTTHRSAADRVIAALRYVQDEIRYLGVEIGVNSHVPYSPDTVLQRRYGDCKDKTLLLIVMLREMGITARPALLSTVYRAHVRDVHPTAALFDHAIVWAELDGRSYWLDPTALYQRGDIRSVGAAFGAALVVGSDSLRTMTAPQLNTPLVEVSVRVDVPDVGAPAKLSVNTWYRGTEANRTRWRLRNTSPEDLQQQYTDYYADLYPSLRSSGPPEIDDDESANVIRTTEEYTVPAFWRPTGDSGSDYRGKLYPLELARIIPGSSSSRRTMPLAVPHPIHIRYTIDAHLKEGWHVAPEDRTIASTAARYRQTVSTQGQVLSLTYVFETLADHAGPAAAVDHLEKMDRIADLLTFVATPPNRSAATTDWRTELNWSVVLAGLFSVAAAIWGLGRVRRIQTVTWPAIGSGGIVDEPAGMGGWLLLVGMGVVLSPLKMVRGVVNGLPAYGTSTWVSLTAPGGSEYHPMWAPVLLIEWIGSIALIVFALYQVWLFIRRKRLFPAFFVVFTSTHFALGLAVALMLSVIPVAQRTPISWSTNWAELAAVLIWGLYMFRSRRVRNTFVN